MSDLIVAEESDIEGFWASECQCLEEVVLKLQIREFCEALYGGRQILQFILIQLQDFQLTKLANPLRHLLNTIGPQRKMIQPLQILDLLRHFA